MYLLRVKGGNRRGRGPNKCDPGQNRSESVSPIHPWKSMSTRVLQCQRLEREKSPDYISAMIFCWYLLFLAALYKIVWKHGLDEPPRGSKTSLRRSGCYWFGKDPRLIIKSSIFKQTQSFTNKLQISCSVGILSTCLPGGKYRDFQKIMFPTFWIFIWPWKSITPLSRASINQEMMSLHFASLPVKEKVNAVQPLTQTLFIPCFLFFVFSVWYF